MQIYIFTRGGRSEGGHICRLESIYHVRLLREPKGQMVGAGMNVTCQASGSYAVRVLLGYCSFSGRRVECFRTSFVAFRFQWINSTRSCSRAEETTSSPNRKVDCPHCRRPDTLPCKSQLAIRKTNKLRSSLPKAMKGDFARPVAHSTSNARFPWQPKEL